MGRDGLDERQTIALMEQAEAWCGKGGVVFTACALQSMV